MRAAPIDAAVRQWTQQVAGPGARLRRARRLHGGITSVVHRLTFDGPDGPPPALVLKRYPTDGAVSPDEAADMVRREAGALERLDGRAGAPRLVAVDPEGDIVGVPAIVQRAVPGRPTVAPADASAFAAQIIAHVRHRWDDPVGTGGLLSLELWHPTPLTPPPWASDAGLWFDAIAALDGFDPLRSTIGEIGPVHRDLHPGNVLWSRGQLAGVVDWVNLGIGPVEVDLARMVVETVLVDPQLGAELRGAALRGFEAAYDPRWDLAVCFELDRWLADLVGFNRLGADVTEALLRRRMEQILRDSLSR